MKQLSEKEEQTKDRKILKLLQKGSATRDEIAKVLGKDLAPSTVTTVISRLEKKEWIKKVSGEEKKWELVSNEELENLILFTCPIKLSKETKGQDYDEFKEKVTGGKNPQKNEKLLEKKDADDFEFYLEKMAEEGSLGYNNGKYSLTESACRKINYCYECKKPISDGETPAVLMNHDMQDIYNLPIHAKCYANWEGRNKFDYHSENFCDYCGLSFSSEGIIRQFENGFDWYAELGKLLTISEKEKFIEAVRAYILQDISFDCKSEIGEEELVSHELAGDLKPFVESLQTDSKFQNIPEYNTEKIMKTKAWNVTLTLNSNYLHALVEKFGKLTVHVYFRKHPNENGVRSLSSVEYQKYKVIKGDLDDWLDAVYERVQMPLETDNTTTEFEGIQSMECKLASVNPFLRTEFSFSNLERFFEFIENHSTNFEVKPERKDEIFKIVSEKENKSSEEARKVVNQLFDPISLITEKMDPPQYHSDYLEHIETWLTEPTGMAWVHKKNGKIYHPYCYDKIKKGEEQK